MYHCQFKGTHYKAGFNFGSNLRRNGKVILESPTFELTEERKEFAKACIPVYENYYPEILEEIHGMADGQETDFEILSAILLSMYAISPAVFCSCIAVQSNGMSFLGRNSDFLVDLEKLYMNCIYDLKNSFKFNGNTTAFIEIEDGMNEMGLAVGFTSVFPVIHKPGLNSGMLVRYLLEKCATVSEAIEAVSNLPLASSQTMTLVDASGNCAVIECGSELVRVIRPDTNAVIAVNSFHHPDMKEFNPPANFDNWHAEERYATLQQAIKNYEDSNPELFLKDTLSGKYGFICQYDRKTNADTVWSVIYDASKKRIYRVEGNPARKPFMEDKRSRFE